MKILSVVGPTAVGKSEVALWLASRITETRHGEVEIISADSRQVYQGLDVVSGIDVPAEFRLQSRSGEYPYPYFQSGAVRLHGLAIIQPNQEWSVAHFQKMATEIIEVAHRHHHYCILVGGTGLYHSHLTNTDPQLTIPPNPQLRMSLEAKNLSELQHELSTVAPHRWAELNASDRANPRRLIRAIEVAQAVPTPAAVTLSQPDLHVVTLGLTDEIEQIAARITTRVRERFEAGAISEVQNLLARYEDWSGPAFTATGVREVRAYLEDQLSTEECLERWAKREIQYAKRQLTWWKKYGQGQWFSVSEPQSRAVIWNWVDDSVLDE